MNELGEVHSPIQVCHLLGDGSVMCSAPPPHAESAPTSLRRARSFDRHDATSELFDWAGCVCVEDGRVWCASQHQATDALVWRDVGVSGCADVMLSGVGHGCAVDAAGNVDCFLVQPSLDGSVSPAGLWTARRIHGLRVGDELHTSLGALCGVDVVGQAFCVDRFFAGWDVGCEGNEGAIGLVGFRGWTPEAAVVPRVIGRASAMLGVCTWHDAALTCQRGCTVEPVRGKTNPRWRPHDATVQHLASPTHEPIVALVRGEESVLGLDQQGALWEWPAEWESSMDWQPRPRIVGEAVLVAPDVDDVASGRGVCRTEADQVWCRGTEETVWRPVETPYRLWPPPGAEE